MSIGGFPPGGAGRGSWGEGASAAAAPRPDLDKQKKMNGWILFELSSLLVSSFLVFIIIIQNIFFFLFVFYFC